MYRRRKIKGRFPPEQCCKATVEVRDTYRYTGRGKSGFELHYTEEQCRRKAKTYCWQHYYLEETERRKGDERGQDTG